MPLSLGTRVRQQLADLVLEVQAVRPGRRAVTALTLRTLGTGTLLYLALSFAGHVGLLVAIALFMPGLGNMADDEIGEEQRSKGSAFALGQAISEEPARRADRWLRPRPRAP